MMVHLGRNIGENSSSDEDDQHAVFVVEDLIWKFLINDLF